uniref:Alpha-tubulin N-acetyltransferase n=1 Tax=Elaeophora elaphi TaxID=1147741 RepID=A0A0R3S5M8_9BILA
MNVPADLSVYFPDMPIQRLNDVMLRQLNPRKCWVVEKTINNMGALSIAAQGLKRVLTSYDKIINSDDGQVLYLLWRKNPNNEKASIIIGLLKIGYKNLYLMDQSMKSFKVAPLCVLDFYVHDTLQRQGYGHALFDYMLQRENSSAENVAIDKPSQSLLQFMNKHYGLNNPIWQVTNFVVYPPFFENIKPFDSVTPVNEPYAKSAKTEAINENQRFYGTPDIRYHDQVGNAMKDSAGMGRRVVDPETAQGRKICRDFEHQSIW